MVTLTKEQAEVVIIALSAAASDEMRYEAWEVLDAALKRDAADRIAKQRGLGGRNAKQ